MSTLAPFYSPFTRAVNTGASEESRCIERQVSEAVRHLRKRDDRQQALVELDSALGKALVEGWDHYGASKAQEGLQPMACRFLNTLPTAIPAPTISIDPDGEASFDWDFGPERMFSVSLSADGRLSYAGMFGRRLRQHGTEIFDDAIPEAVVVGIQRAAGLWK